MKRTATLISLLLMVLAMVARPVSPVAARQAAQRFLQAQGSQLKGEAFHAPGQSASSSTEEDAKLGSFTHYYVFNASAGKGFVVVSGDDCVGENLVLGYTQLGSFDAEAIPTNMQWWFDEMNRQINLLSSMGMKAPKMTLHEDVAPLVTALWNQGDGIYNPENPYNALCPETDGLLCVTGCMATALAQVLYYHRWPQAPLARPLHAYTMENGRHIDGLPVTTFDWDDMVDDYLQPTTEERRWLWLNSCATADNRQAADMPSWWTATKSMTAKATIM